MVKLAIKSLNYAKTGGNSMKITQGERNLFKAVNDVTVEHKTTSY